MTTSIGPQLCWNVEDMDSLDDLMVYFPKEFEGSVDDLIKVSRQTLIIGYLTDRWGWDRIIHLRNGKVLIEDRNSGIHFVSRSRMSVNTAISRITKALGVRYEIREP